MKLHKVDLTCPYCARPSKDMSTSIVVGSVEPKHGVFKCFHCKKNVHVYDLSDDDDNACHWYVSPWYEEAAPVGQMERT